MTSKNPHNRRAGRARRAAAALALVWLLIAPAAPAAADPTPAPTTTCNPLTCQVTTPDWASPTTLLDQCTDTSAASCFRIVDADGTSIWNYNQWDSGWYPPTDSVEHPKDAITDVVSEVLFSIDIGLIWATCWLLKISLSFSIAHLLLGPVSSVANAYQTHIVGPLNLKDLAVVICLAIWGLQALRGRVGKGLGEIAVTFLIAGLSTLVLTDPAGAILGDNGVVGWAEQAGLTVVSLPLLGDDSTGIHQCNNGTTACQPGDQATATAGDVETVFRSALIDAFVREPHGLIEYGVDFNVKGPHGESNQCRDAYNTILKEQPDKAWDVMNDCNRVYGDYAHHPNLGLRVIELLILDVGALLVFLMVLTTVVLVTVGGQVALAGLAGLVVIAVPVSLTGGLGRRPLWLWCGAVATVVMVLVTGYGALAFEVVTVQAIEQAPSGSLIYKDVLIVLVSAIMIVIAQRMLHTARTSGRIVARRLDRAHIGGSGSRIPIGPRYTIRGMNYDLGRYVTAPISRAVGGFTRGFREGLGGGAGGGQPELAGPAPDDEYAGPGGGGECAGCGGDGWIQIENVDGDWMEISCPDCQTV